MKIGALLTAKKMEPEAGESTALESGESSEFEAGEDEESSEGSMDLSSISDDALIAELKKRGHEVEDSAEEGGAPSLPSYSAMPPM